LKKRKGRTGVKTRQGFEINWATVSLFGREGGPALFKRRGAAGTGARSWGSRMRMERRVTSFRMSKGSGGRELEVRGLWRILARKGKTGIGCREQEQSPFSGAQTKGWPGPEDSPLGFLAKKPMARLLGKRLDRASRPGLTFPGQSLVFRGSVRKKKKPQGALGE